MAYAAQEPGLRPTFRHFSRGLAAVGLAGGSLLEIGGGAFLWSGSSWRIIRARRSLCIILPTYNEEGGIGPCIEATLAHWQALTDRLGVRLVVVDAGSTDATVSQARALTTAHLGLEVLRLQRHYGKEAAILAGLSHCRADAP
jgi:hypothetical protein